MNFPLSSGGFGRFPNSGELVAWLHAADTGGMKKAEQENPTIILATAGLELRFPRLGDQHGFAVWLHSELVLETKTSAETIAWPESPPLQQLHEQLLPTGAAVLGVGSAGTTHWSASFSVREPGLVWCEYAARVSQPWQPASEWLGTRLHLAQGWTGERSEQGLLLHGKDRLLKLALLGPESSLETIGVGEFELRPAEAFPRRTKTIEWKVALLGK